MSMPNFSSLAGLEVTEKFVGGGVGGFQVSTISNEVAFRVALSWDELSWVTLGFDNKYELYQNSWNFLSIGILAIIAEYLRNEQLLVIIALPPLTTVLVVVLLQLSSSQNCIRSWPLEIRNPLFVFWLKTKNFGTTTAQFEEVCFTITKFWKGKS